MLGRGKLTTKGWGTKGKGLREEGREGGKCQERMGQATMRWGGDGKGGWGAPLHCN